MFRTTHDVSPKRRFVSAATGLAVLMAYSEPSYAAGLADLHRESVVYGGPAAMLGVRVPFGGEARHSAQPIVSFGVGSSWRAAPGSFDTGGYGFIRSAELGFSLRGDPFLRLGSLELGLDRLHASAEEGEASTYCGRNLAACIVLGVTGVILVAGGAFLLAHNDAFKGGY